MMAALRHPNIVAFLGVCADPPAVVTEYCRRGSLTGKCALLWCTRRLQGPSQSGQTARAGPVLRCQAGAAACHAARRASGC